MSLIPFEPIPIKDNGELLVNLAGLGFFLEPVYFKQELSNDNRLFLRKSVVDKLIRIQDSFKIYKFKIWDGYRSRDIQNKIYEKYWTEQKLKHPDWDSEELKIEVGKFVSDAKNLSRIPPHATGGTVDLTLTDSSGKELEMGTVFDYFGPEAASLYFEENNINNHIRDNRRILRQVMTEEDFRVDPDEWWHFDYGNQQWAYALKRPYAFYGEAERPR